MTNSENVPILQLSKNQSDINKKKSILVKLTSYSSDLNDVYEAFPSAYQNNNLYALFNLSEEFYANSVGIIHLSSFLFKNKLIELDGHDANIIIRNINHLANYIDALKTERNEWIEETTLLEDPSFADAVHEGDLSFKELKNRIQDFFKTSSKDTPPAEDAPSPRIKRYKLI